MLGLSSGTELLKLARDPDDPAWYQAQLAIDGTPCVPFSFTTDTYNGLSEMELGSYLEEQARNMIGIYGDARNPTLDRALMQ